MLKHAAHFSFWSGKYINIFEAHKMAPSSVQLQLLELSSRMGVALFQIQKAEYVLKKLITIFLRASTLSWEQVLSQEEKERKRTLGYFMKELRKATPVRNDFDEELTRFVKDRNTFIHDFFNVPGFSLENGRGLQAGIDFVSSVTKQAEEVRKVLWAYVRLIMGEDSLKDHIGPDITDAQMYELMAIGVFLQGDQRDE
jgi:hypothetical protein